MADSLIIPKQQQRGAFVNGWPFIVLIIALVVVGLAIYAAIAQFNQPNLGSDVTAGPNGTSTATHPNYDDSPVIPHVQQAPVEQRVPPSVVTVTPVPSVTAAPMVMRQTSAGGSTTRSDDDAREAQRRRYEKALREADERYQRLVDASMSLSGVTMPKDDPSDGSPVAEASPTEYAAPAAPVLGIGTKIPVSLTQALDSTFGGRFSVPVTDDVKDERGDRVIIPRGSTCFAKTTQGGVDGQARIYASLDLCKLPNLERIAFDDFPAVDVDGATGLKARVDDHGAGKHNRGAAWAGVPGMLAAALIPGVGSGIATTAISATQQASAGRAVPGPTLYLDASPQHPRPFAFVITKDVVIGGN
jgi:type IV secretory pathway VirB10-like protein